VVERQSYRLSRLIYLTRVSSCSIGCHLKGTQFSDLIAECKEILTGIMEMLESKAVKIVEDPELEPQVVAELVL